MKKAFLLTILLAFTLVLAACANGSNTSNPNQADESVSLSTETQLALGTLRLEDTEQVVDAREAAQLLPLWQLLNQLNTSGSAAQEEMDAVVEQIHATMTAEQIQAISEMGLTQGDILAVSQDQGAASGSSTAITAGTNLQSSSQSPAGGDPGMAGGPPADGGIPPDGNFPGEAVTGSGQQSSATSPSQTSGNTDSTALIEKVIELLESKLQS